MVLSGLNNQITSSPKGNNRSPESKSSKYFEYSRIKDFFNLSRAAHSAVHGWIQPNFKLIWDYIVVLLTCKNHEDPIRNEGARVLTSLLLDFSDAQGQLTQQSMVESCPMSNLSEILWLSSIPARMKKI